MNQPCDTCGDSYKQRNLSRNVAREQAQKLANEQQKTYIIFQEASEWKYCEISAAISLGIPFKEVIPGHTSAA